MSGGGAAGGIEYRSEEEWLSICGSHVNVSLIADSTAQALAPKTNLEPITLHVATMATVQEVKETLCSKIGAPQFTPQAISV